MGRNVGRHPHRDSRRPVNEQVGKLGRQNLGLKGSGGIVGAQVDRLVAQLAQEHRGDRSQTAFGVPHGRGGVAVDRSEVAVALDHWVAQAERLGHPHQCVIDRLVAVGVIGLHDLTHDSRRLDVSAVGREVQVRPHRVQDAPLNRLQAVADIGEGTRGDHAQSVVQVPCPGRLCQRDVLDEPVAPRLAVFFLTAPAVPFRHRLALNLDPTSRNFVTIPQIQTRLNRITVPVSREDVQSILYGFSVDGEAVPRPRAFAWIARAEGGSQVRFWAADNFCRRHSMLRLAVSSAPGEKSKTSTETQRS